MFRFCFECLVRIEDIEKGDENVGKVKCNYSLVFRLPVITIQILAKRNDPISVNVNLIKFLRKVFERRNIAHEFDIETRLQVFSLSVCNFTYPIVIPDKHI